MKEQERYEVEVIAKQIEIPTIRIAPYTLYIDRTLLKNFLFMGKFEEIADEVSDAKDLTSTPIKTYIESLIERMRTVEVDPFVIESALKEFTITTQLDDADARITPIGAGFFKWLQNVFCEAFKENHPKQNKNILLNVYNHRP